MKGGAKSGRLTIMQNQGKPSRPREMGLREARLRNFETSHSEKRVNYIDCKVLSSGLSNKTQHQLIDRRLAKHDPF